jgi:hypothetical protein
MFGRERSVFLHALLLLALEWCKEPCRGHPYTSYSFAHLPIPSKDASLRYHVLGDMERYVPEPSSELQCVPTTVGPGFRSE